MASSRSLDFGWLFLRLAVGLHFLRNGAARFDANNLELYAIALLICGVALVIGLLVRPAVVLMMVLMISVYVSGSRLEFKMVRDSIIELLILIGFLIGGGGPCMALGAAISGLRDRWHQ